MMQISYYLMTFNDNHYVILWRRNYQVSIAFSASKHNKSTSVVFYVMCVAHIMIHELHIREIWLDHGSKKNNNMASEIRKSLL